MIYFITGGERSGKSSHAQQLALRLSSNPVYLATAKQWDSDFQKRIARHKAERDSRWINIEEETYISKPLLVGKVVVLDCITLWLTNIFMAKKSDLDLSLDFAKQELANAFEIECTWIIISNEIGMGVHASTELGRKFVELQGWTNQFIAKAADEVYFMVSGLSLRVKPALNAKL
jgi:adenosylcobinamide kinase / adenosylcobinamide-phosphate guanylyltransferase